VARPGRNSKGMQDDPAFLADPGQTLLHMEADERDVALMRHALRLAQRAADTGEVPVGALVYDPATGEIVAQAHNQPIARHDPTGHAEILALRQAAEQRGNYRLTGLWLVVTLEPCTMCVGAISHARIGRLVYGADDPKGGAVTNEARFFDTPACHWRPEVKAGVEAEAASLMLKQFFRMRRR